MSEQRKRAFGFSDGGTLRAYGHEIPRSDPDPGAEMRERASEACGFHMGQNSTDSRAELERRGGPESIITRAVQRAEAQMRASDAEAGELTRQAAILKDKLRRGER
jgi:hypothetical protein